MKKLLIALALAANTIGQSATVPQGFTETLVANGITQATAMAIAPDGRIFVSQQGGQMRVIKNGTLLPTPFVTVNTVTGGSLGLLGVAFDPNFAVNHYVYAHYTVPSPTHNRVSRWTANGDVAVAGSEFVVIDLDPVTDVQHMGGALHFGSDGKLYVSTGDDSNGANSQNLSNLRGKMLRLNSNGSAPCDNPFVGTNGVAPEIWAFGLRNPFTFNVSSDGTIYINDVGQNTYEEIDQGQAGANYGWPNSEGPTNNQGETGPIYYYGHNIGCSIVGGAFYIPTNVTFPASYVGKYFFGDDCGGWIHLFSPASGTASDFLTGATQDVDLRVSDIDGCLYRLDRGTGGVYKIAFTDGNPTPTPTATPTVTPTPTPNGGPTVNSMTVNGQPFNNGAVLQVGTPYTFVANASADTWKVEFVQGNNSQMAFPPPPLKYQRTFNGPFASTSLTATPITQAGVRGTPLTVTFSVQ